MSKEASASLRDGLSRLGAEENIAKRRKVEKKGGRTYATMSTICAPPLLRGLVHLDVLDDQVSGIEAFGVGVGFGVLEQAEEELGGFLGPAGFGDAELLAYRNDLLVVWFRLVLKPLLGKHV